MKKILSTIVTVVLLFTLLPVYSMAVNNGPAPADYDIYDVAFISVFDPSGSSDTKKIFAEHKTYNKAIDGATYDKKTNTLTLKNFKQPKKGISINAMGEDFKLKLSGTNKVGTISVWGYGWGGNIQITGSGSLEINKNKIVDNAINLYGEGASSQLKINKTATVNLYAKKYVINTQGTTTNSASKAVKLSNGQSVTVKKSQAYYESYEWVPFKTDTMTTSGAAIYKDSNGTKYVVLDYYYDTPTEIYKLGSEDSDGYYTGTKSTIAFSSLTRLTTKEKIEGCYDYVVNAKSLTIPAGSSVTTTISKLTAKSKGFKVKWNKKSVTGYQVQYSTSSKFTSATTATIKKASTVSTTIKKLKAKKKYYVRVRTYKTVSGQKLYSAWSKAKNVTTK